MEQLVSIRAGKVFLQGNCAIPEGASGVVLFAHGSGSSRFSPRNCFVAETLQSRGFANRGHPSQSRGYVANAHERRAPTRRKLLSGAAPD